MSRQTKEIPFRDKHYPHRTCGHKNRKKYAKLLTKALCSGSLGQFTGSCTFRKLDETDYEYRERRKKLINE